MKIYTKLKNKKTGKEYSYQIKTINEFDYYIDEESKPKIGDFLICGDYINQCSNGDQQFCNSCEKVIATNNPNLNIPKIWIKQSSDEVMLEFVNWIKNMKENNYDPEELIQIFKDEKDRKTFFIIEHRYTVK